LPYIYSEAWQVSSKGSTMMRPLVMDFKNDPTAIKQPYQYMFGRSFLVAPITEPGVWEWNVYLPGSTDWYDFWSGRRFRGGQTITTAAPQDKIPVFVRAGSIVPMGKNLQYSSEKAMDTLDIRIYAGTDGQFNLYSDEGDNYNYEKGNYVLIPFQWNEQMQTLTIGKQQGKYPGALQQYVFNIVLVKESQGHGIHRSPVTKRIIYKGEKTKVVVK
jgi:alpha-D-xyloside xylohydrolase